MSLHGANSDDAAVRARTGHAATLIDALQASRRDTLQQLDRYVEALGPQLQVPYRASLNPPLWELGHIGWFQEFWTTRNPHWQRGVQADPDVARRDGVRPDAEALYHSSHVPHASRWHLPLPDADATRDDLQRQLDATLAQLQSLGPEADDDAALYFGRLALFHEDMHHEAALYMARHLDLPLHDTRWAPTPLSGPRTELFWAAGRHRMAPDPGGFHFDNEAAFRDVALPDTYIDRRVVSWAEYLPFVEAGGYEDRRWWTDEGWHWREQGRRRVPCHLAFEHGRWRQRRSARWHDVNGDEAAEHLTAHEARAWCRWAGRRLPTEAEWERAALSGQGDFHWGDVWEWTDSAFEPFDGFEPHPYRDYSQPWFDGRPVLRGASYLTQPRMRHRRYRNYFTADRDDIVAGFRSCRL